MPPVMPPLKLPCLCSSPPSLALFPPLFLLIRRPRVVAFVRAMLTATPVSPPATSSPSALAVAPVPRDVPARPNHIKSMKGQLISCLKY
ncbi:hypothetical protein ERO13_D02G104601v2 [Gossypium hirsutum]|nr:hypothetical protein ERO13_D02G104601v2 [Gossypium hirsutum]